MDYLITVVRMRTLLVLGLVATKVVAEMALANGYAPSLLSSMMVAPAQIHCHAAWLARGWSPEAVFKKV